MLSVPAGNTLQSLLNPVRFSLHTCSAGFGAPPSLRLVIGFRWCPLSVSPGDAAAAAAERCAAAAAAATAAASWFWSRRQRRFLFVFPFGNQLPPGSRSCFSHGYSLVD